MALTCNPRNGLLTGTTLGNVTTSQSYSNYGELSSYTANYSSSPMFQTTYTRDSLGHITTLNETELGVARTLNYSYDSVGRLEKVWRNDTLVSMYSYDANGNRIAHWTPTEIDSGTYDAQDRMLSYGGTQYLYGRNGDLQTKIAGTDTTKYTYDAFGNLTQVVMPPAPSGNGDVIQYVVDGRNRRTAKKVNGRITNKWFYAGQLTPIAELDSADNVIARFSGGYMNKRDTIYQIITDHVGSPRVVVNVSTGAVVQRMDYDEFGNVIYDSNPGYQPFGFAGGLYDPETKLVRFGARDYDPSSGRWADKDSILFHGGVSNLYEYCVNDPVNQFDESGLQVMQWIYNALGFNVSLPSSGQSEGQAQAQQEEQNAANIPTQQQMDELELNYLDNVEYYTGMEYAAAAGAVANVALVSECPVVGDAEATFKFDLQLHNGDYPTAASGTAVYIQGKVTGIPVGPAITGAQVGVYIYQQVVPPPPKP